jgi:hypothetical protein
MPEAAAGGRGHPTGAGEMPLAPLRAEAYMQFTFLDIARR